ESPRPPDYGDHEILAMDTIASPEQIPRVNTRPPPVAPRPREAPRPLTAITPPKEVKLRPTLFLGLGGLAGWTLRRLRRRLQRRFGDLAAVPILRLLLLDTDRASLSSAHPEEPGESPSLDETLLVPLRKNDHYRQESRELLRWLDRNFLYGIPRSLQTEGYRPLGRLALVDNLPLVMDRLREVLSALTDREALAATRSATGLSLREETPRVFLVAGISGGTGSGMVLDMAFAVKQVLAELRLSEEGVCGLLLHGTCADLDLTQKLRARANAYATLTELNHFSKPGICYPGDPQHGLAAFGPEDYPFEECYLVHLGEELNEVQAEGAADFLAEYLYLDAATTVGSFLDPYRLSTHTAPFHPGLDTPLRTLGLDRLCFPRHNLAEEAGRLLCHRIVTRWQGKLEEGADVQIQEEAVRQAEAVGLEGEALARELVGAVETFWREDPETYLQNQLIRWQLDPLPSRAAPNSPEQIQWLLRKIDDLLPEGQDLGLGLKAPQDSLEGALRAQADELAESRCQGIVQWLTTLVEDPQQRLKAADAALRGLLRHLSGMAESLRGQLGDCRGSRETLRQRLSNGEPIGKGGGGRWLNLGRRQGSAGDPNQKFLEYGWLRLKEILLENVAEVLRLVSRRLGELVQELSLARQKLEHFAAAFTPADHTAEGPAPLPNLTELLPDQCRTLGEAGRLLFQRLEGKLGRELDETFQAEVLGPQGGLWGLVAKTWDLNEGLKNDLHRRAQAALLENLKEVDAARLFLEAHPDPDRAKEVLLSHVLTAAPKLITSQGWQHLVASLPPGPAGDQLRDLVSRECAPTPTTLLESEGDLLFLYEVAHLPLQKLAAELIEHASTLHEVSRKVMTRIDVKWSYLTLNEE
ncbi:MAG: hypothetical protein JO112_22480, partial [Planctomycetes bacterium]|nr:hypothetical protein [Planctomycetota bacterium]